LSSNFKNGFFEWEPLIRLWEGEGRTDEDKQIVVVIVVVVVWKEEGGRERERERTKHTEKSSGAKRDTQRPHAHFQLISTKDQQDQTEVTETTKAQDLRAS
jgi:hypothetical protein